MLRAIKKYRKTLLSGLVAFGTLLCLQAPSIAAEGWGNVRSVSDQCFVERDVAGVGKTMIYNKDTAFGFVFVFDETFQLSDERPVATFVKSDGFSDFFKLQKKGENIATFDVPVGYFDLNKPANIREIILYSPTSQSSFPLAMDNAYFRKLSNCDIRPIQERNTDGETLELSKVREQGVFDVFFDEYIVQERSPLEDEIVVQRVAQDEDKGFANAPSFDDTLILDEKEPPFIETANAVIQESIFIPVDTVIDDVQINLDEQLEIIDSLTEKIKILELEKQYLREELDTNTKDPIKLVVGAASN